MQIGKCKDCKHWATEKENDKRIASGVDARACALEPFDVTDMKEKDCAVYCGHDGSISFGSEYGCIKWEPKEI